MTPNPSISGTMLSSKGQATFGSVPCGAIGSSLRNERRKKLANFFSFVSGGGTRAGVPPGIPGARCAFKNSMTRWFLRFAPRIAFRCVLHPRENRDIHRKELSFIVIHFSQFDLMCMFGFRRCLPISVSMVWGKKALLKK